MDAPPDLDAQRPLGGCGPVALFLVAGAVLVASFVFGMSSAQSPNNCGELPGITSGMTMLLAVGAAIALAIAGAVAALVTRSWSVLGACVLIGLAAPIGVALGQGLVTTTPCDSLNGPVGGQVPATIYFRFTSPYAGAAPEGPAECRRIENGERFYEIVSQGGHAEFLTNWRFGDPNDKFVDIGIWPVTPGPDAPAHNLRVNIYRLAGEGTQEASADYTDTGSGTIQLDTNVDGSTGSIVFTDLPAGNVSGTGLPPSITGRVTWSCAASEPTP